MSCFDRILILACSGLFYLTAFSAAAHEPHDGDIWGAGIVSLNRNWPTDHAYNPTWLPGLGAIFEADIDYHGGPELTALYTRQMYSIQKDSLIQTELCKRMYIALGYRHWFNSHFSLGAAFYSSYAMGDPEVVESQFVTASAPKTSAYDPTDYGFEFSSTGDLATIHEITFTLSARYSRTVTAKPGESADFYSVLIGFKKLIQKR